MSQRLSVAAALSFLVISSPSVAEPNIDARLAHGPAFTIAESGSQGGASFSIRNRLAEAHAIVFEDRRIRDAVTAFYESRSFEPAWLAPNGTWSDRAARVVARLRFARVDGFEPADYERPSFASLGARAADVATADIEVSSALAAYALHAFGGRVDIRRLAPFVYATPPIPDLAGVLARIADTDATAAMLESLHPAHPRFVALRLELERLLATDTQLQSVSRRPIPSGPALRLGMSDMRVPALRERFALTAPETRSDVVDAALVAAVRAFQRAHGLEPTGVVGSATLRALNRGDTRSSGAPADRLAEIIVNMERWRWLPRDLGDLHVWVNVPEYLVRVVQSGRERFVGRTVVGKRETPTPMFSDELEYFVVNPSWTVPPGIARREFFPLLASNPEALARRGIQVIRNGRRTVFRQPPGERNALGRIKFMFPNDHSIYLHDTPARGYFQRQVRAFSNGCVRVDNPLAFAEAVFQRKANMTVGRIEGMYGNSERHVRLRHKVPVHLAYFTLMIDEHGESRRLADVYGLDERMRGLLGL
jgi:murein L,D-transpeptidase YcbB/YkuD